MNATSLSKHFVSLLLLLGFLAMFITAGAHFFPKILGEDERPTEARRLALQALPENAPQPEFKLSDEQMAEIGELMGKLQANSDDWNTLFALGETFLKVGEWSRSEFFLSKAVVSKPADIKTRYMLGIAQYQQSKISDAVKTFEDLLAIKDDPTTMYNLALIYKYQTNDAERARELLKKAAEAPDVTEDVAERSRKELE